VQWHFLCLQYVCIVKWFWYIIIFFSVISKNSMIYLLTDMFRSVFLMDKSWSMWDIMECYVIFNMKFMLYLYDWIKLILMLAKYFWWEFSCQFVLSTPVHASHAHLTNDNLNILVCWWNHSYSLIYLFICSDWFSYSDCVVKS
jgi:hypothetical protein